MQFTAQRFLKPLAVLALLTTTLATLTGCTSTQGVAQQAVFETPDGIAIVDVFTTVATVTAINATTRKVTMQSPDGKSNTYKAGANVDLGRFRVGESIGVQVSEEMALEIKTGDTPARDAIATSLATASDGGEAAVFEGEAVEVSAKIAAVDPQKHTVMLQLADGTSKTIKANGKVNLSTLQVGNTMIVKYATSMVVAFANS